MSGDSEIVTPLRFKRVLLGGDELATECVMWRGGGIQLKTELSIKRSE